MSDKIIIVGSLVPEVQKRIDNDCYVTPWIDSEKKHYMDLLMEKERCKIDFKFWFDKCIKINNNAD